jgi:integrase/recombinase XerD
MDDYITFSQAVEGYLLDATARKLSDDTIHDYLNTFRKFDIFLENDPLIQRITPMDVKVFLAEQEVSKKTLLNYHVGLSALWTWAVAENIVDEHIIRKVRRPKPEKKAIKPYTEEEVRAMLSSLTRSKLYFRPGKRACDHKIRNAERNRAIILLLLDTGTRSSELCGLKINHVDVKTRRVRVYGKGDKERFLPFSPRTGQAIWRYLTKRGEDHLGAYLFTKLSGRPMDRDAMYKMIKVIAERAGVRGATVHRFRHTFAINYLRNGGDPWSLRMMLGHATMGMVENYLALAEADLVNTHNIASPVANWRL